MTVKLLTEQHLEFVSLKGACTGSSEFTLVKMLHCWKSHVTARLLFYSLYTGNPWRGTLANSEDPDDILVGESKKFPIILNFRNSILKICSMPTKYSQFQVKWSNVLGQTENKSEKLLWSP